MRGDVPIRTPAFWIALTVATLAAGCDGESQRRGLRLATTTSVVDSGLLAHLAQRFAADGGAQLEAFAVGSGKAVDLALSGEVDLVITHDPAAEARLRESGRVVVQRSFARNPFVLAGPAGDPAGVKAAPSAVDAFRAIHRAQAPFASRGDRSGTHSRELELWRAAGKDPLANPGYVSLGQSMSALLRSASELGAYALTDGATFDQLKKNLRLAILRQDDPLFENVYTVTVVHRPGSKASGEAMAFAKWLLGERGREAVREFRVGGRQRFFLLEEAP